MTALRTDKKSTIRKLNSMKIAKTWCPIVLTTLGLSACSSNDDDAMLETGILSEGVTITLRNTLQEGGPEGTFPALFGLPDDAYDETGTMSFAASEFPTALAQPGSPAGDISGLYDIDLSANSISYTLLPSTDDPFWSNVFGVFPAGKFDRYYLTFSEPHGITNSTSTNSSVNLRIDSETVVVVEIAEGYDMNPPMSFSIRLE